MKLSLMTGEQLRHALCELSAPLCRLLQDERTSALLEKVADPAVPLSAVTALLVGQGIPLLLETHQEDTFAVLAILTGKSPDDLRSMNALALMQLVKASWDEEFAAFFASAGGAPRARCSRQ